MDGSIEALLSVDRSALSQPELLDHLAELKTVQARVAAAVELDIAAATDPDDAKNLGREELALLMRWSFGFTQARIVQAHKLARHLPGTLAALAAGVINPEHARAAAEACYGLAPALCARVEARVLNRAGEQTLTEFKRALTRAVHCVDPRSAEQRHRAAKQREKGVWLRPLPDGLAGVWSVHDAVTAHNIVTCVRDAEKSRPPIDGNGRGVDERRADILADLILGNPDPTTDTDTDTDTRTANWSAGKVGVNIVVPLAVAMGLSDLPGELVGYGPIPAALCRQALADPASQWSRFVVAPTEQNLHARCCRHHHLKHDANWHVTRCTNGDTEWTSPTGRHYTKPPDPWPDG